MLTFDDYERYLQTHETPYDRIGHHRLHLQLYVNGKGRDCVLRHLAPELSHLWLDNIVYDIEDTLIDHDASQALLRGGKYLYRSNPSLAVEIMIEPTHVGVRVVSYPPIRHSVRDELDQAEFEEQLHKEENHFAKEQASRLDLDEDRAFRNMFTDPSSDSRDPDDG